MKQRLLLIPALIFIVVLFGVDYALPAVTLAPLAVISVMMVTLATNLWGGLALSLVGGIAFSFVDAIQPSGRDPDAAAFVLAYASCAVLVEIMRRLAAREIALSREQIAAKAAHDQFMPPSISEFPPWRFQIVHVPLGDLGGDFYDIKKQNDGLGIFVCDVSGKGLKAAMLLGAVKVLFQEPPLVSVENRLRRMNEAFMTVCGDGMFCTAWYGSFRSDGTVCISLAGHEPGYVRAGGVITPLPSGGLPLGVSDATIFELYEVYLAESDVLLLHTDGVSELLASDSISIEELFADASELEARIRAAKRRDDILIVTATRMASPIRAERREPCDEQIGLASEHVGVCSTIYAREWAPGRRSAPYFGFASPRRS